jgi:hypothetical protein
MKRKKHGSRKINFFLHGSAMRAEPTVSGQRTVFFNGHRIVHPTVLSDPVLFKTQRLRDNSSAKQSGPAFA